MSTNNSRMTSTEVTNLFTQYIQDTMFICISKHVLATVKDSDVQSLYEFAVGISKKHVEKIEEFLNKENVPIPIGFSDQDVNVEAPPLFADTFWLYFLQTMTHNGLSSYSLAFGNSIRQDILDYYYQCNIDAMEVYKKCVGILLSKGLYEEPPYFSTPQAAEMITNLGYALDVIGEKRPMNSAEAGSIFFNLTKTRLASGVLLGFSQVAKNKDARQFFEKAYNTASNVYESFSSLFREENLLAPKLLDQEVTQSTIPPFSDKLMMIWLGFIQGAAITYYSTAQVSSIRVDLVGQCEKVILSILKNMPSWGNVVIENGWLEKLPQASDRNE